jgi:hypothetical protein
MWKTLRVADASLLGAVDQLIISTKENPADDV